MNHNSTYKSVDPKYQSPRRRLKIPQKFEDYQIGESGSKQVKVNHTNVIEDILQCKYEIISIPDEHLSIAFCRMNTNVNSASESMDQGMDKPERPHRKRKIPQRFEGYQIGKTKLINRQVKIDHENFIEEVREVNCEAMPVPEEHLPSKPCEMNTNVKHACENMDLKQVKVDHINVIEDIHQCKYESIPVSVEHLSTAFYGMNANVNFASVSMDMDRDKPERPHRKRKIPQRFEGYQIGKTKLINRQVKIDHENFIEEVREVNCEAMPVPEEHLPSELCGMNTHVKLAHESIDLKYERSHRQLKIPKKFNDYELCENVLVSKQVKVEPPDFIVEDQRCYSDIMSIPESQVSSAHVQDLSTDCTGGIKKNMNQQRMRPLLNTVGFDSVMCKKERVGLQWFFICKVCHRFFKQKGNLVRHMRVHTGERPYKCRTCGKAFTQSNALQAHIRTHNKQYPYGCPVCYKRFSQKGNLKEHIRTHTGEQPYKCQDCGKSFSQSYGLKQHSYAHMFEQRYACKICNKTYTYLPSLKYHIGHTHKAIKCSHCDKYFTCKNELRKHERIHL